MPRSKLDAMREDLVRAARSRSTITYGVLMQRHGLSRGRPLTAAIGTIDRMELERGAPGFAALIVRRDTGYPGGGYFCDDDLPADLRNPKEKSTDPRLSLAQKKYVLRRQKEVWDHYGKSKG
jgi:hypothetical protein